MATFLKPYQILCKKALVDFNTAKILRTAYEKGEAELDLDVIYFHLQQCVEKLLKALLDFHHVKFPHTHDLQSLIRQLQEHEISTIERIDELIPLTDFAVEGRYAVLHDDLEENETYFDLVDALVISIQGSISMPKSAQ